MKTCHNDPKESTPAAIAIIVAILLVIGITAWRISPALLWIGAGVMLIATLICVAACMRTRPVNKKGN